jgi:hypothetical protein
MNEYLAWLLALPSADQAVVHQAADYFATVHAHDMEAVLVQLEALTERVRRLEAGQRPLEVERGA